MALGLTLAVGISLAPAAAADTPEAQPVTLNILWSDWGSSYDKFMMQIGNEYEQQHPGVKLNWTFSEQWQDKLAAEVAGGDPPDVTYASWSTLGNLAGQGLIESLDMLARQAGWSAAQFVPAMWQGAQYEGKLYAVPGGGDYITMFYNKDLMSAAGIDAAHPPSTIDAFTAATRKLTKLDAQGRLVTGGYMPLDDWGDDYIHWAFIFGGKFFDQDGTQVTLGDPNNLDALNWLVGISQRLGGLKNYQDLDGEQAFGEGKFGFHIDGFWEYQQLDENAVDMHYGVAPLPTPDGTPDEMSRYLTTGWYVALPTGTQHAQAAWDFIQWAFVGHSGEMGALTLNGPTAIAGFPEFTRVLTNQMGSTNRLVPYLSVFLQTAQYGAAHWPATPITLDYYNAVTKLESDALAGKETPGQLLTEAANQLKAQFAAKLANVKQ